MWRPDLRLRERREVERTITAVAACQNADGSLPWADGHVDPWNHVEAAMALTVGNRQREAERAYRWLARRRRADGSLCISYRDGRAVDHGVDANFCAYLAAGLWHFTVATGDDALLAELWPAIEGVVAVVLDLQRPGGEVVWARRPDGTAHRFALLTSSAAIHLSLRHAAAAARHLGCPRPGWDQAADRIAHAVATRPAAFVAKDRFSMDWYYPVLSGCLRGRDARERLATGWSTFVADGAGCRCVADRPWFTAAETGELVLTLDAVGLAAQAERLYDDIQGMRAPGGGYWTGIVLPEDVPWPEEQPAWTAAAVILAADALLGLSAASGFFRALHEGSIDADRGCEAGALRVAGAGRT